MEGGRICSNFGMSYSSNMLSSLDIFGGSLVEYRELVELSKKHSGPALSTTSGDDKHSIKRWIIGGLRWITGGLRWITGRLRSIYD